MAEVLQEHRALLLACEAIGWLHMTGKAHPDFLRHHGGAGVAYDEKRWTERLDPAWSDRLDWLGANKTLQWPDSLVEFSTRYAEGRSVENVVGCLQAGQARAAGIEKCVPRDASRDLTHHAPHMRRPTAGAHQARNVLAAPPQHLPPGG